MFSENISILATICDLASQLGSHSFEWSRNERKLIYSVTNKHKSFGNMRILLANAFVCAYTLQYIFDYYFTKVSMATRLVSTISLVILIVLTLMVAECYRRASDVILYINGLIQFDTMYGSRSRKGFWGNLKHQPLLMQLNILFAAGLTSTDFILPAVVVYGLHCFYPCKTSLLFYWLLPECHSGCGTNFAGNSIIKAVVFLINHWMWMYVCCGGVFVYGILETMSFVSLRENVKCFWKHYKNSNLPLDSLIRIYRHIQVLARCVNEICQRRLTAYIILFTVFIHGVAWSILIKSMGNKDSEDRMVMLVFSITCIVGGESISETSKKSCFEGPDIDS